jgi:uncharacterized protein YjbI with pentapeptide repeats
VYLEGAALREANLEGADLEVVNLEGAKLDLANLEGVTDTTACATASTLGLDRS